jgi:hypothetical protein
MVLKISTHPRYTQLNTLDAACVGRVSWLPGIKMRTDESVSRGNPLIE